MTAYLEHAARTLRAILTARESEHVWTVEVVERDRNDAHGRAATPDRHANASPEREHADAIREHRAGAPTAGACDDHAGEQAA